MSSFRKGVSGRSTESVWNSESPFFRPTRSGRSARNLARAGDLVASSGADVALLPEMFATGFCTDPAAVAEPAEGGAILGAMRRWAARGGCAVAGSVAVAAPEGFRNRM